MRSAILIGWQWADLYLNIGKLDSRFKKWKWIWNITANRFVCWCCFFFVAALAFSNGLLWTLKQPMNTISGLPLLVIAVIWISVVGIQIVWLNIYKICIYHRKINKISSSFAVYNMKSIHYYPVKTVSYNQLALQWILRYFVGFLWLPLLLASQEQFVTIRFSKPRKIKLMTADPVQYTIYNVQCTISRMEWIVNNSRKCAR